LSSYEEERKQEEEGCHAGSRQDKIGRHALIFMPVIKKTDEYGYSCHNTGKCGQ
jgi:hypothetical protein